LRDVDAPTFSRQSDGGKVVSPTRRPPFTPPGRFLVLISLTGWVDPRAIVRLKALGKLKKFTSTGLDPATFRLPDFSLPSQSWTANISSSSWCRPTWMTEDLKSSIFWDITPCSLMKVDGRFWGTGSASYLHHAGLLFEFLYNPEDGDNMFLQNVGWLSKEYTPSQGRTLHNHRSDNHKCQNGILVVIRSQVINIISYLHWGSLPTVKAVSLSVRGRGGQ
jgi:hypothetical protein